MKLFKTQAQLIQEIHNAFDTAQDRLLSEAHEIILKANTAEQPVEILHDRLKAVGFTKTPITKQVEEIKKQRELVVKTHDEAKLIEYYKQTYPFLKFLTESELHKICDKYNLIFAPVSNYIENVPEKNLQDIEQAQVLKSTDVPSRTGLFSGTIYCSMDYVKLDKILDNKCRGLKDIEFEYIDKHNFKYELSDETKIALSVLKALQINVDIKKTEYPYIWMKNTKIDWTLRDGLFIAAPSSHFNLEGVSKKGKHGFFNMFTQEVKDDPIVFRYVRGGIQVLTKWGLEANDPALVLPVNN